MRAAGVLMHLTSLPSPHGIGTMGAAARDFVDFLAAAGQRYWQILPVCPTSYGDSPYQSFSTYAGNPYLIDLDLLAADGLLEPGEYQNIDWESPPGPGQLRGAVPKTMGGTAQSLRPAAGPTARRLPGIL